MPVTSTNIFCSNGKPARQRSGPVRLAIWYGKGGVGKSTTTMILSLMAAQAGRRVLAIDLDPECGTSRDFLGSQLPRVPEHLKTFLESPAPLALPVIASGIEGLEIVPCPPDEQRFFRLYREKSTALREALDLLPPSYDWIVMDVPNQFDNIAELGLIAADCLILPVELTDDCAERVPTALRIINEARSLNPALHVLGALCLGSAPRGGPWPHLSAKERFIRDEYAAKLSQADIPLFKTIMFRSSTTVEEARNAADDRLMHWTARRRFRSLMAEIHARLRARALALAASLPSHARKTRQFPAQSCRTAATASRRSP